MKMNEIKGLETKELAEKLETAVANYDQLKLKAFLSMSPRRHSASALRSCLLRQSLLLDVITIKTLKKDEKQGN